MRIPHVVALSVAVLGIGVAFAQEKSLPTVEIRAEESDKTLTMACVDPAEPSLKDVERVLSVSDPAQSRGLRTKLMEAASEACKANQPRILVTRGANGSLTWKPFES